MTINNKTKDNAAFKRILKAMLDGAILEGYDQTMNVLGQNIMECMNAFDISHDNLQGYLNMYIASYNKYHNEKVTITQSYGNNIHISIGGTGCMSNIQQAPVRSINEVIFEEYIIKLLHLNISEYNPVVPVQHLKTIEDKCKAIMDNYNSEIVIAQTICGIDSTFIDKVLNVYIQNYDYHFNYSKLDMPNEYNNSKDINILKEYQCKEKSIKKEIFTALVLDGLKIFIQNTEKPIIDKRTILSGFSICIRSRLDIFDRTLGLTSCEKNTIIEQCLTRVSYDIDIINRLEFLNSIDAYNTSHNTDSVIDKNLDKGNISLEFEGGFSIKVSANKI